MVYKLFDKKSKGSGIKSMSNQQFADELHKQIIRKFKMAILRKVKPNSHFQSS